MPQVELTQDRPGVGGDAEAPQLGIMGKNQLSVGTTPDIRLNRAGDGRGREESGQVVIGKLARPTPVADNNRQVAHPTPFEKSFTADETDVIVRPEKPPFPRDLLLTERL